MRRLWLIGMIGCLVFWLASSLVAQPFTYQGMLKQNGQPVNGTVVMTFRLYDALTGGSQIGAPITQTVSVQNGLFTVALDFGAVWTGADRYLEIQVGSTTLSPRVKVTATPYAMYALKPWEPNGSALFYNGGNVGIGTNSPAARLSLGGGNADTKLALWQGNSTGEIMGLGVGPAQFRLHLHNSANRFSFLNAPNGNEVVTIKGDGSVGIGTNSPVARLHIVGGNLRVDSGAIQSGGPIILHPDVDNSGDDVVRFVDSTGNETMRIHSDGNVGIGTNSPAARLSLGGGNASTKLALWQGNSASEMMGLGVGPSQFRLHLNHSGDRFSFLNAPNGSELVTIKGDGKVGIGTSSPGAKLSLGGDAANTKLALWQESITGEIMGLGVGPAQFRLHLSHSRDRFSFLDAPNGNELVTILGTGYVGIGTSSPAARLHIVGGNLRVDDGAIQSWGPITLHPDVDRSGDDVVRFVDSTGNETMRIHSDGNVGIGTNSPSVRLHVVATTANQAIYGHHSATAGQYYGVYGQSDGTNGAGVYGWASANSGTTYGVCGVSASTGGRGVAGWATATTGDTTGVVGRNDSTGGRGVYGWASAATGETYGVLGVSYSTSGYGVYSYGRSGASGTKQFQIDHPLMPETHYLNHFCTEAPEPLNAYSGNVVTDAQGYAVVQLPPYFETINRDFRYQLTCIGQFAQAIVAQEIQNNQFVIRTDRPNVKVSWRVEAVRNDRWVQQYGFQTEQPKPDERKGKYLHPELYGQPKEKGIFYHPEPERPAEPTREETRPN